PAIDAGDNGVVTVATDLDGHPRRTDVATVADTGSGTAPIVDMGAYEYHSRALAIAKSAPTVVAGTPLTYTLVVSNTGQEAVSGVLVTDAVPAGASYLSGGIESGGVVTWDGLTVEAGGVATATFSVSTCQASLVNEWYRVITSTEGVTTAWGAPLATDLAEPSINAGFDLTPEIALSGETVHFDAASSTDGSPIAAWQWDFGDENTGSGSAVTHPYTAANTYTVTLRVSDTCGYTAAASRTVHVSGTPFVPIYGVDLTPPAMTASGDPGDDVIYDLWITNSGSVSDTFDLSLDGNAWTTVVAPTVVNLQPSEMRKVAVTVSVAGAAQCTDTDVVTVTATSRVSPTTRSASAATTLANTTRGVEVYPPTSTRSGDIRGPVAHTLSVTNIGNCSDSFTIDVGGNAWKTEPSITDTASLSPGAGMEVDVWVTIPFTAAGGENDVATFTATSQNDQTVLDTDVLTTTAEADCTEVEDVTLDVTNIGDVHPNTLLEFEADLETDNVSSYAYRLTSDGVPGLVQTAANDPLTWTDVFTESGEHAVEIAVWNCAMSEDQAVEDTVTVLVVPAHAGPTQIYLPLVACDYAAPATIHELEDAPDTCPGHTVTVGNHLYLDDFDALNDHDWYSFEAVAGQTYTIQTSELQARADTSIALYGDDCTTVLAENDDVAWPDDVASRIVWTAQASGTYHVDARSYDWQVHGNDTGYTFGVHFGAAEVDVDRRTPEALRPVKPLPPVEP
ncbi:MAG: PKD domain-containing protein, partial [bacterium]|nr:PKD domain-containing protein [bacterium]